MWLLNFIFDIWNYLCGLAWTVGDMFWNASFLIAITAILLLAIVTVAYCIQCGDIREARTQEEHAWNLWYAAVDATEIANSKKAKAVAELLLSETRSAEYLSSADALREELEGVQRELAQQEELILKLTPAPKAKRCKSKKPLPA